MGKEMSAEKRFNVRMFVPGVLTGVVAFLFKMADAIVMPSYRLHAYDITDYTVKHRLRHDANTSAGEIESQTQSEAALLIMAISTVQTIGPILAITTCGSWIDKIGAKIPIVITCLGAIAAATVSAAFPSSREMIVVGAAIQGSFGSMCYISMSLHSILCVLITDDTRVLSFGLLQVIDQIGAALGSVAVSQLWTSLTFPYLLALASGFYMMAAVSAIFALPEVTLFTAEGYAEHEDDAGDDDPTLGHLCVCTVSDLYQSILHVLRARVGMKRCLLLSFSAMLLLHQLCKHGEQEVLLLFTKHDPLHWSAAQYAYLLTFERVALILSTLFLLPLTSHIKCDELKLLTALTAMRVTKPTVIAFSTQTWTVFTAKSINLLEGVWVPLVRTKLSRLVTVHELGKVFAVVWFLEALGNLLGSTVFVLFYWETEAYFPGMCFLGMSAILIIMTCGLFVLKVLEQMKDECEPSDPTKESQGNVIE